MNPAEQRFHEEERLMTFLEEAKNCAKKGNYVLTEQFLNDAEALAQQTNRELSDTETILKTAYEKGLERNLKEAEEYLKDFKGQNTLEIIKEKIENTDYCSQKLGKNIENNKRIILQQVHKKLSEQYIDFANKFLQNKNLDAYELQKEKAEKHAEETNQDITAKLSLMEQCKKNVNESYKNKPSTYVGPYEKIFLN